MRRLELLACLPLLALCACPEPVELVVAADSSVPPDSGPDAQAAVPEETAATCSDGEDNDVDGRTDCQDSDCALFTFCARPDAGPPLGLDASVALDASEGQDAGGTPSCSVDPSGTIDFGRVAVGTRAQRSIELTNTSAVPFAIVVEGILGSDSSAFSLPQLAPGEHTVPAGGKLAIPVEFAPDHIGSHVALLSFTVPNACALAVVPLSGAGVDQVLDCFPRVWVTDPGTGQSIATCQLDFGPVLPGATRTATLGFENVGSDDVEVGGLTLVQDSKGPAFSSVGPMTSVTVPAGGRALLTLGFGPSLLGTYQGKLDFVSTDPKRPSGSFVLEGLGGGPAIEVQPLSLDFGIVGVNGTQSRNLGIANQGADVPGTTADHLRLVAAEAGTLCGGHADCTAASPECFASTCWHDQAAELVTAFPGEWSLGWPPAGYPSDGLAAGQSASLKVTFSPASTGTKTATVRISSNDPARPTLEVSLTGAAQVLPACSLTVSPSSLVFGNVEPGRTSTLAVVVRNVLPSSDCLLYSLDFGAATPAAFSLVDGPVAGRTLHGGEELPVPVRFAPTANGTYSGLLVLSSSDSAQPEVQIPLSGSSQTGCLLLAPSEVDFGTVETGCSSRERVVTVYNVCPANQTVVSITSPGPEFAITQVDLLPKVLSSGASMQLKVEYSPTGIGSDLSSIQVQTAQLSQPYVVPVHGEADASGIQTDTFHSPDKADVLFVVDNSGSMSDKQAALGQAFASFIQFATTQQVDFRIATTTTGVDPAHGGDYDNGDDLNGCFSAAPGNPKVLTPQTPNLAQVFAQNAQVGTAGNVTEMLIRPAYLALSQPNLGACNAGFLREDATLSVISVSDAADQDSVPVSFYLSFLLSLKAPNLVTFSGVLPVDPVPSSCSTDAEALSNTRVEQVINGLAGLKEDICSSDWSAAMARIGQTAFGYRTRFFLSTPPDLSQGPIVVEVDGVGYPDTGPYGDVRWTYDGAANAIDFNTLAVPEPTAVVTASYHVHCF